MFAVTVATFVGLHVVSNSWNTGYVHACNIVNATVSRGQLYLPDPSTIFLGVDDLQRLAGQTEAADVALIELHSAYQSAADDSRSDIQRLISEAEALSNVRSESGITDEYAARFIELMNGRNDTVNRLRRLESELFLGLQQAIEPEQLPALERIRDARDRTWACALPVTVPGADVDLSVMVRDGAAMDDEALSMIDPILLAYERAVTPAMSERAEDAITCHVVDVQAVAALLQNQQDEQQSNEQRTEDERAILIERQRLREEQVERDVAVREINERYVKRLRDALPAEAAESLRLSFEERTYPGLARDQDFALPVIDTALGLGDLSSSQRTQLDAIKQSFLRAYERIQDDLHEAFNEWREHIAAAQAAHVSVQNAYHARRDELLAQRGELNARTRTRLRGALTPEQAEQLDLK